MATIVWHDYANSRRPGYVRGPNHRRKLAEFIAWLNGQNYFTKPHWVVSLKEDQVTGEVIDMWAKVRRYIAMTEAEPAQGKKPLPPLFLLADELERISPNLANLRAAERDLLAAVGARVALTSEADKKLLQYL
ncbi:MAG TPA: hypothetical protein VFY90_04620 [Tepidiformaceae bacterium]|nr:hypothetical protein [Tepidiformaceae bacterium]